VQEHIGTPHNQEDMPYQATEKVLESQMQQRSFLIDQCHLNPIKYQKSIRSENQKNMPNFGFFKYRLHIQKHTTSRQDQPMQDIQSISLNPFQMW
jgi:hypothetical protein